MAEANQESKFQCMLRCDAAFIQYTAKHSVGGVEGLRICRETCRGDGTDMPAAEGVNPS